MATSQTIRSFVSWWHSGCFQVFAIRNIVIAKIILSKDTYMCKSFRTGTVISAEYHPKSSIIWWKGMYPFFEKYYKMTSQVLVSAEYYWC